MLSLIDLTHESGSEESDEDLKLAIAMSLSQQDNNNNSTSPKPAVVQPAKTGGLMGLDRKQMEAERLARQAQLKRKRGDEGKPISISPPPLSRRTRTRSPPSLSSPKKTAMAETKTTKKTPQPAPPKSTLQFPNGIVKRTWISSHPRTDRDITFSELIDAPNLKSAVLSSFIWDFDWLFTQVRTKETKFVLVMHAQSPTHISLLQSDFTGIPNIRLIFPPTTPHGCMHSKLQLLFYETHCRLVVPTANLTTSDWGECGRLENMLFVIDLPLLCTADSSNTTTNIANKNKNPNSTSPFYASLLHFLTAQSIPPDVLTRLSTFDFSATLTNNIAFVHSIAGTHTDPDVRATTGRLGLSSAVSLMGLGVRRAEGESIEVDYVTSSVGNLTGEFLGGLFAAMEGGDEQYGDNMIVQNGKGRNLLQSAAGKVDLKGNGGITAVFNPANRSRSLSKGSEDEGTEDEASATNRDTAPSKKTASYPSLVPIKPHWSTNLRIFFPSTHTIAASLGGPDAAGTICFQRRWWENGKFPRNVMRDCVAARKGVLMHSKVILVRFVGPLNDADGDQAKQQSRQKEQRKYAGWVYVGSANCSESAWGVLSGGKRKGKKTTGPKRSRKVGEGDGIGGNGNVKLTCRNWECGVILPVPVPAHEGKVKGLEVFESVLPVPMVYPGKMYEGNRDLEPWFFG